MLGVFYVEHNLDPSWSHVGQTVVLRLQVSIRVNDILLLPLVLRLDTHLGKGALRVQVGVFGSVVVGVVLVQRLVHLPLLEGTKQIVIAFSVVTVDLVVHGLQTVQFVVRDLHVVDQVHVKLRKPPALVLHVGQRLRVLLHELFWRGQDNQMITYHFSIKYN